MPTPLIKHAIIKKKTSKFLRHHNDRYKRISYATWRRPKGIDSSVRRRYKGVTPMVKVGYGTNDKHRHIMPNGFLKFRVFNVKDLELLMMQNRKYAAEIAHNVSSRKRKDIVARAQQLNVKVTNPNAKVRTQEAE